MEYFQHKDGKKFILISSWEVIHFAIIYIAKHSLEKHTGDNVPHYALLISIFDMCITLYQYMHLYENSTK